MLSYDGFCRPQSGVPGQVEAPPAAAGRAPLRVLGAPRGAARLHAGPAARAAGARGRQQVLHAAEAQAGLAQDQGGVLRGAVSTQERPGLFIALTQSFERVQ